MIICYKSHTNWARKSRGAYGAVKHNDWFDEATFHIEPAFVWTHEMVLEDANKYETRTEWKRASGAYGAACAKGWLEESTAHMPENISYVSKWRTKETFLEDALQYHFRRAWSESSDTTFKVAQKNGWYEEATAHMKVLRKNWTEEVVPEEARKHKTVKDWVKASQASYNAAGYRG